MDASDETRTTPARSCPDCGVAVQPGQRRCTNCGASVEQRRRLPRRTPLVAALAVAVLGGGAVVVAQAQVTERATADASAPAEASGAPVGAPVAALPGPLNPTSTAPKPPKAKEPAPTPPPISIPKLDSDVVQQASDARDQASDDAKDKQDKDGENLPSDGKADDKDLTSEKKLKVKQAENYDPLARVGVEFGKPKAAIDKRTRTVWDVNVPADGQDFSVGIVLDLGTTQRVSSLRIQTPTPGFGATILRADAKTLPPTILSADWQVAAQVKSVSDDVVVPLSDEPEWARYVLLMLTTPRDPSDTRVAIANLEILP